MLPGAQNFTKTNEDTLPESETPIEMEQFGKIAWQAIDQDGSRSQTFVTTGTKGWPIYNRRLLKLKMQKN